MANEKSPQQGTLLEGVPQEVMAVAKLATVAIGMRMGLDLAAKAALAMTQRVVPTMTQGAPAMASAPSPPTPKNGR
jgi:hypothetical protein